MAAGPLVGGRPLVFRVARLFVGRCALADDVDEVMAVPDQRNPADHGRQSGRTPLRPVAPRPFLEATSEAVYVVDRQRRVTHWNPAAEQLTAYRADEVIGRHCREGILNHVDDRGVLLCASRCPLLATIRQGQPHAAVAFLQHRHNHRVPAAVRLSLACQRRIGSPLAERCA